MALNRVAPHADALNTGMGTAAAVLRGLGAGGERNRWMLGGMVGRSSAMERIFLQMRYLANHLRLALVEGERGTGKRLLAETLHGLTPFRSAPFVHCPASGFFADPSFTARLAEARGGTLYLSGIDALTLEEQARLTHLLAWIHPARLHGLPASPLSGHADAHPAPRAIVLSSTRALRPLVLCGKFRSDLQQQLAPVHMALPALRDRLGDLPMLTEQFLERWNAAAHREGGRVLRGLAPDLLPLLTGQRWPGNIRELHTVLAQAAARSQGEWLRARDAAPACGNAALAAPSLWLARPGESARLQEGPQPVSARAPRPAHAFAPKQGTGSTLDSILPAQLGAISEQNADADFLATPKTNLDQNLDPNLDRAILRHIRLVLLSVGGNKLRAARLLGISRSTLYRLLDAEGGHPSRPA